MENTDFSEEELERELEVIALMKRAMDPEDPYTGEDEEDVDYDKD